ncbi:calcium-translocating P-type ATPase, PMCA-type [Parasporobacterium paucivorans]|uniref:P-type Ca(2+) transporter n=1 Tax=Parasporobacterium paucivorans DSM 15970 TaxID=1122934 RepID=A0A1M6IZI1_9FIRM|nr:calcium-translocating P-type ATPase, PMCA-type [Parasporobacterium paucivorans]SHJ39866.1 Ca2+-transporting ATPase [Parasporobacterium paucivorans DSM 15970]
MNAFMETKEQTLRRLNVDSTIGLTASQAAESAKTNGINSFSKKKPDSMAKRIWEAASEPMIIMLIIAAIITLGVNIARYFRSGNADFIECLGIFAAISLSVIITVVMEGRSAKAFEALSKINEDTQVRLIRNGEIQLIPQKDIVVGDIVYVETGDKLPADGRLLEGIALSADESSLTGESLPVDKDSDMLPDNEETPVAERTNMLFSGSFITGGSGKMVVTGVGDNTEFGQIAKELSSTEKGSTPLQEQLARLGKTITILGATMAAIVFIIQVIIFISNGTANIEIISEAFITSIILIVAAVPEGLPTIVAVSLAVNIIKMSKQNALVKKMIACETIGCINVICSDKTGTLTENRMTVTDVYTDRELVRPNEMHNALLLDNFCINSTADVNYEGAQPKFIGNPTECALLVAAHEAGNEYKDIRSNAKIAHVFPFTSETKNMTTIVEADKGYAVYTKGSPEKILDLCMVSGSLAKEIEEKIRGFQEKACRVIAFAHKEFNQISDFSSNRKEIESNMVYDGFVAITDPLREDVYIAVERCRNAGIDLKMLTGDNIVTAIAIANELHLLGEEHRAVEAKELEHLSDEELADILPQIRVIARSTPIIKMRVVNALKSCGNVVAVTGDGINDAPAIKNADVGIAMGISGTEVSKEASDIVLLDDSFSTIVKAVQWGRGIYENFQRFIQFQLTVNLSSVVVVLFSILVGFKSPFSALELLWINIIMDGPPALTLGLEPIRSDLMKRQPVSRGSSIVSKGMLGRIVFNGLFISAVFMSQTAFNFLGGTPEQVSTILFTLFVVFQLFNAFNSRELTNHSVFANFTNNKLMLLVFGITFALQVIITQFGSALFGTVPLPFIMWMKIVGVAFSVIIVSEVLKLIKRYLFK